MDFLVRQLRRLLGGISLLSAPFFPPALHDVGLESHTGAAHDYVASLAVSPRPSLAELGQQLAGRDGTGSDGRPIAEAIIAMAHKLRLQVIAEGVETAEQSAWLQAAGCDYAQGYYFSAPVPAPDFAQLLQRNTVPESAATQRRHHH